MDSTPNQYHNSCMDQHIHNQSKIGIFRATFAKQSNYLARTKAQDY